MAESDPFYSFGQHLQSLPSSAEDRYDLENEAQRRGREDGVPVSAPKPTRKGKKYNTRGSSKGGKVLRNPKQGWRTNATVNNPHKAHVQNQRLQQLVAKRAANLK